MAGRRFWQSSTKSGLQQESPRRLAAEITAHAPTPSGAMRNTWQLESEVWK